MFVNQNFLNSLQNFIFLQSTFLGVEGCKPFVLSDRITTDARYFRRNEYGFWVYCNLLEDLIALVNLLRSYVCPGPYASIMRSGDPLYNLARSTLEKYADILNFNSLSLKFGNGRRFDEYSNYLVFLKNAQDYEYRKSPEYNTESLRLCKMLGLGGKYVNRKTRYVLAKQEASFPWLPYQDQDKLRKFTETLSSLDAKFSPRLHGNPPDQEVNIYDNIEKVYKLVVLVSIGAFTNFCQYENFSFANILYSPYAPSLSTFLPINPYFIGQ